MNDAIIGKEILKKKKRIVLFIILESFIIKIVRRNFVYEVRLYVLIVEVTISLKSFK